MAGQLKLIQTEKEAKSMDRQKALDAALAQIDRAFGKGIGDAAGFEGGDAGRGDFNRIAGA